MKMNKIVRIAMFGIIALVLTTAVFALGVSPARRNVDYVSGESVTLPFKVINDEMKGMNVMIYSQGDMGEYIQLTENPLRFFSEDDFIVSNYKIDFPIIEPTPGVHQAKIVLIELPEDFTGAGDALVTGTVGVIQQIRIRVPYPGKYLEAVLFASDAGVGEEVVFSIPITNYGKEHIFEISAEIKIYDGLGKEVASVYSTKASLSPSQDGKLTATWFVDTLPGPYTAKAILDYDGIKIDLDTNFRIGDVFVDILSIDSKNFKLGDIAKFDIAIENKWNSRISGLFAEMVVLDGSKVLTRYRTAPIEIGPLERSELSTFWETKGVEPGSYTMQIILYYEGKTTEEEFDILVEDNRIRVGFAPTGFVTKQEQVSLTDIVLIGLLVLMVIINIVWFAYFRNKKRKV